MSPLSLSSTAFVEVEPPSMPMKPPTVGSLLENGGREFLAAIGVFENVQIFGAIFDQALAAGLGLFFLAPEVDVVNQLVVAAIAAHAIVFGASEFDRAERREILRVLRNFDQVFAASSLREPPPCAPSTCAECWPARPRACRE